VGPAAATGDETARMSNGRPERLDEIELQRGGARHTPVG
jgi:hypothetical protein